MCGIFCYGMVSKADDKSSNIKYEPDPLSTFNIISLNTFISVVPVL